MQLNYPMVVSVVCFYGFFEHLALYRVSSGDLGLSSEQPEVG